MKILHRHSIHLVPASDDVDNKRFISEASDLRFRPGEWPELVVIVDDEKKVKYSFKRKNAIVSSIKNGSWSREDDQELYGYHYKTDNGLELEVYND